MRLVYSIFMPNDIPVLIIAYKRAENLMRIFEICKNSEIKRIYIAVDAPASNDDFFAVEKVKKLVSELEENHNVEVISHFASKNAGCSAGVISACDWFFDLEPFGVIIEDDCIPSIDFFGFMRRAIPIIENDSNIWLASGTQFFPEILVGSSWALSKYPMHWGWGTTADAWRESRNELDSNPPSVLKFLKSLRSSELIYWFAGERRAFFGFTDVWDSIYASNMVRLGRLAIVPSTNLVSNIGNDTFATNTVGVQRYTQLPTVKYESDSQSPVRNLKYDEKIYRDFFRIRPRHYFSTFYTLLLDGIFAKRKIFLNLNLRLIRSRFTN